MMSFVVFMIGLTYAGGMLFAEKSKLSRKLVAASFILINSFGLLFVGPHFFRLINIHNSSLVVSGDPLAPVSIVAQTDPRLLNGLKIVDFSARPPFDVWLFMRNSDAAGEYLPIDDAIYIPINGNFGYDAERFPEIWWHELGHHVWYTMLSDNGKKLWTAAYELDLAQPIMNESFVSGYAKTDVTEDFAETFSIYMNDYPQMSLLRQTEAGKQRLAIIRSLLNEVVGCSDVNNGCGRTTGKI